MNNDFEVVWNGRGPLPGSQDWPTMYRNYTLERAPSTKDWPTQEDGRRIKEMFDKHPWTHKKQRSRKGVRRASSIKLS